MIFGEALSMLGRKRIGDASAARGIALRPEADDLSEIIGGASGSELFENGEIELGLGACEPPAQMEPGVSVFAGALRLRLSDKIGEWARQPVPAVLIVPFELRGLDSIQITAPSITVAAPLRVQCPHCRRRAPQRYLSADKTLAEAVEQLGSVNTQQSLTD